MKKNISILILGWGRSGKDTAAELIEKYTGLEFCSSSLFCAETVVFPELAEKYNYKNAIECFEDRANHREEWFNLINDYNNPDGAKMAREMMKESSIYVGMRDYRELKDCKEDNIFDIILWIDAPKRCKKESVKSMNLTKEHADIIIENNGTLEEFEDKIRRFCKILKTNFDI